MYIGQHYSNKPTNENGQSVAVVRWGYIVLNGLRSSVHRCLASREDALTNYELRA